MLKMIGRGKIIKMPESKISTKGTPYLKVTVEMPPAREGMWPKRVYLTAFGKLAQEYEGKLFINDEIEFQADPSARGYTDKIGKVNGLLEGVIKTLKIVKQFKLQAPAAQPIQEPAFSEDDIPF